MIGDVGSSVRNFHSTEPSLFRCRFLSGVLVLDLTSGGEGAALVSRRVDFLGQECFG